MGVDEILDDLKEKLQDPTIRWTVVGLVVLVLLRLRLVLFAAAVPLLVYWHYSNQQRVEENEPQERVPIPPKRNGQPQAQDDDFDEDEDFADDPRPDRDVDVVNPYDDSFWDEKPKQTVASGGTRMSSLQRDDDDDDYCGKRHDKADLDSGLGLAGLNASMGGDLDDGLLGLGGNGSLGAGGGDFDFGVNDMSFLNSSLDDMNFGGFGGKGKGKNKNDGGKGKGKGEGKPKDPRQVFVGGIGNLDEETITEFFEEHGTIERVKIVLDKGFGFVTFRTEEEAEEVASRFPRGAEIDGRRVTVRLANSDRNADKGGGKGEKNDRFGGKDNRGKGKGKSRDYDDPSRDFGDMPQRDRDFGAPPQRSEPTERGGANDNDEDDREPVDELDYIIQEALAEEDSPLKLSDFDAGAKRFLEELRRRDANRALDALDTVLTQTKSKSRDSVRKWPAYVFTLLQKFDKNLADELAEMNIKRKLEEREARRAEGGSTRADVARAKQFAPPAEDGKRQVLDRWGKPVVLE